MIPNHPLTRLLLLLLLWLSLSAQTIYIVQRGDTLASIARRHGTSITALAQANNLVNPNLIYPNQRLIIPSNNQPPTQPPTQPTPTPPTTGSFVYVVQLGDTLRRISLRFGVSTAVLAQTNNISNPNIIYVGQPLIIPAPAPSPTPPSNQPPNQPTPAPPTTSNLLPNSSFEGGWYHPNGAAELQIPNGWRFEWDQGPTGWGNNPWDVYNRPEVRVLNRAYLPPSEHNLFILQGNQTVKAFKGMSPISYRLLTEVALPAGTYRLTVRFVPDLVMGYENGQKVPPSDPSAGEVRLITPGGGSVWFPANQGGQAQTLSHQFTLSQPQTVTVGGAFRARYAISNNGFFMDDWSLVR
jgi:LysM repeat protein